MSSYTWVHNAPHSATLSTIIKEIEKKAQRRSA
jgi:hypothetical protein